MHSEVSKYPRSYTVALSSTAIPQSPEFEPSVQLLGEPALRLGRDCPSLAPYRHSAGATLESGLEELIQDVLAYKACRHSSGQGSGGYGIKWTSIIVALARLVLPGAIVR